MCVHINTLPDDCLLPIFDRVPLSDLLQLNRVCPRWKCLLPSACARRRTLVLILGWQRVSDIDCFKIPFNNTFDVSLDCGKLYFDLPLVERENSLTSPSTCIRPVPDFRRSHVRLSVSYLTEHFPNVDKLVVIHAKCDEDQLHSMIDLLRFWSVKILKVWLQTVDIDQRYCDRAELHPVLTLLHCINQQSSLQQLTLEMCSDGQLKCVVFPEESYSFIAQLKVVKLCLGLNDRPDLILDIVHRFDSTKLRHIGLGNYYQSSVDAVLDPKFEFTTKVNQLYCGNLHGLQTVEKLGEFCWRYCSLTVLQIRWPPHITFTQLLANLAKLEQLTHLELTIPSNRHPVNLFALVDGEEPRRLSRVKILELYITKRSHSYFESLSSQLFPSAEVIILHDSPYYKNCSICQPDDEYENEEVTSRVAYICDQRLIRSLKDSFANSAVRHYARNSVSGSSLGHIIVDRLNFHLYNSDDEDDEEEGGEKGASFE